MRPLRLAALLLLSACSAAQTQQNQTVVMKVGADLQHAVVSGCAGLPTIEVLVSTIEPFLPPDPRVIAGEATATVAGTVANQVCAKVNASMATGQAMPVVGK